MKTYSEKLKDPRWQKKRLEVFTRDNWKCRHCTSGENTLAVHHLAYSQSGDPWDIDSGKLQTLCEPCHNLLKGLIPGSVIFDTDSLSFLKGCPKCGSQDIRDKGSYDACNDCGMRFGLCSPFI